MHGNNAMSLVLVDKGFKIKCWHWPEMQISADMTGQELNFEKHCESAFAGGPSQYK